MRTNTWLSLILLQQVERSFYDTLDAKAQKERDEARDAMFAKAADAAQQGQFAMWVQTPDGQRFERWSHHALEASRAIDDRQAAWDLAWEQELEYRREVARPQLLAEAEASVPEVSADVTQSSRRQGIIAGIATIVLGIVWVALVLASPYTPEGDMVLTPESVIAFVLMLVASIVAVRKIWVSTAEGRRRKRIDEKVAGAIQNIHIEERGFWHQRATAERLREVQTMISEVVENAPQKYPRNDDLVPLSEAYQTRHPQPEDESAPSSIQRLLEGFRQQDTERRAVLERDGIA